MRGASFRGGEESDPLARVSSSPTVRKQLRTALTAEELNYLLAVGFVIEEQALTPAGIDDIRSVIREEIELLANAARRDEREEQELRGLLGDDCPPLPRRLVEALHQDEALREREAVEIVYQVKWFTLSEREQARYRSRLRQVQKALNDRLMLRKTGLRVVRPSGGWLFLHDRDNPEALAEAREECRPMRRSERAEVERLARQPGGLEEAVEQALRQLRGQSNEDNPDRVTRPATVEECLALVRQYLAGGPKRSRELDKFCAARGCSAATIRRARKRLDVQAFREGFGGTGGWFVRLPPDGHTSQKRHRAPL
jgi:hypothetical protein